MQNENVTGDSIQMTDFDRPKLNSTLNVLTILSFIGCALQLIGAGWGFYSAKNNYDQKDKMLEQINSANVPKAAKAFMPDTAHLEEILIKSYENRLPILILGLVAVGLCFYGVTQMRKLKKQGFLFYVIGELLPFLSMVLFIGTFSLAGFAFYFGVCIALLFIILYAMQRKNLVY